MRRVAGIAAVLGIAGAALLPGAASATTIACTSDPPDPAATNVVAHVGSPGERNLVTFGYRPGVEKIFVRDRYRIPPDPFSINEIACGPTPGGWDEAASELGDLNDRLRLDGADLPPKFRNPLPAYVEVAGEGGAGDDELFGHGGRNDFFGDGGEDLIATKGGPDSIDADDGEVDEVRGGRGGDAIFADDGAPDIVNCGRGVDFADVDGTDVRSGCEQFD